MRESAIEVQFPNGVKFSSSNPSVVICALLIELAQLTVCRIRSTPPSKEPVYFGGNIYELEADREALFRAQARQR